MSAIDRLNDHATALDVDFYIARDGSRINPENRYELRWHEDGDRFIERGTTIYEVAAKAADRLDQRATALSENDS